MNNSETMINKGKCVNGESRCNCDEGNVNGGQLFLAPNIATHTLEHTSNYVKQPGIIRYNHALQNLIPVRHEETDRKGMPLDDAGLFSYVFLSWMTQYLWKAYKSGITINDLPQASSCDTANYNARRFELLWQDELNKHGPINASFATVAWKFVRTRVYVACTLLSCSVLFGFISPAICMRNLLEHLQSPNGTIWDGLKWVMLLTLCDFLRTMFFTWTWVTNYRTALRLKSAYVTALYKKLIKMNSLGNKSRGQIINLFSNDSQRIFDVVIYASMIVSGPIVTLCGILYILWLFSPIALLGMVAFFLFYPCQYLISRVNGYFRSKTIRITDVRIRLMNEIFECIKVIKMYAWEKHFGSNLFDIRKKEKKWLHKTAYFQSLSLSLTPAMPMISAIVTFLAHVAAGNSLTASEAFPITSFFGNLIRLALVGLKDSTRHFVEALVTFRRYKSIMLLDENNCHISKPIVKSQAVTIANGTFVCDSTAIQKDFSYYSNDKQKKSNASSSENSTELEKLSRPSEESKYIEVLTNIHFGAPKGKIIGICGSVGSGKSSLLLAALGQLRITKGHVSREGTCAYVSQQAWIINATFKENILFGEQCDAKRYYQALTVCCLKEDLNMLPGGDETEIGERGINLSGGQKQRVALARALYANRDIYFLDDPLSAVDPHVGAYIFENLILGALHGKTILFVTHQVPFLQYCNHIYMMHCGKIIEHGTHEELMTLNEEYAVMVNSTSLKTESKLSKGSQLGEGSEIYGKSGLFPMRNQVLALKSDNQNESDKQMELIQNKGAVLMVEDKVETGVVKFHTYLAYIKAAGGYFIAIIVFFGVFLNVGSTAFSSWWLATWINAGAANVTRGNETLVSENIKDNPNFHYYQTIYALCILAIILTSFFRGLILTYTTINAATVLHNKIFKRMIDASLTFFETTPSGRIQNIFSRDIDEVDNYLPIAVESMIQNIIYCCISIFFICWVLPWFCIPLIFLGALFFFISKIFRVAIRDLKRMESISRAPVLSFVTTTIQGLSTIHAFNKEKDFMNKYEELFDLNNLCLHMCQAGMRWSAIRLDMLAIISTSITALLVTFFKGDISPALAGLALAYAAQMSGAFQYTVRLMSETEVRFISVERINYYLRTLEKEGQNEKLLIQPNKNWPAFGKIEFTQVSMKYRKELPLVLINVSFTIKAGEKIGVVGRTGSGKSSLLVALFRLVDISTGIIKIDGVDVSKVNLETLRSKLSIIPQEPVLFSGTIRSNLDPFNEQKDDIIWTALEKTQLKEKVKLMPEQLNASVGFEGNNLSLGEKQLLCLTRALLRRSQILILDEATAAVDPETEITVQNTIKNEFADCTVITIAHRLQTVASCDRILVMNNGKVSEFDTVANLLSKPNSKFAEMMAAATRQ